MPVTESASESTVPSGFNSTPVSSVSILAEAEVSLSGGETALPLSHDVKAKRVKTVTSAARSRRDVCLDRVNFLSLFILTGQVLSEIWEKAWIWENPYIIFA